MSGGTEGPRWRRRTISAIAIALVILLLAFFLAVPPVDGQAPAPLNVRISTIDTTETMVLHRVSWRRDGVAEHQLVSYGVGTFADSVGIRARDTTRAFFLPLSRDTGWVCVLATTSSSRARHCRPVLPTLARLRDSLPRPRDSLPPAPPRDTTPTPPPATPLPPRDSAADVGLFFGIDWDTLTTERHRASRLPKYAPASQTIDREAPPAPGARASLRIDYAAKSASDPDRCDDHSVGFTPIGDGSPITYPPGTREVYTELWVRWEPGYDTRAPAEWQCKRAADQKIWRNYPHIPAGARNTYNSLNVGNQGGAFLLFRPAGDPVDGTAASNVRGPDVWTGQWIRFRMANRLSCSQEKTGRSTVDVAWFDASGRLVKEVRLWADGVSYIQHGPEGPGVPYDGTAVATYDRASGVPYCSYAYARVGLNRNLHPPRPLRMWYGPYRVFLTRPQGWKE